MERPYRDKSNSWLYDAYDHIITQTNAIKANCMGSPPPQKFREAIVEEIARRWYEAETSSRNLSGTLKAGDTAWYVDHGDGSITEVLIRSEVYYSTDGEHRRVCGGYIIEFPHTKRQKALASWSIGYNLFKSKEDASNEIAAHGDL